VTVLWIIKWSSSITLPNTSSSKTLSETPASANIDKTALGGGLAGGCLLLIITAGVAFHLGKLKGNKLLSCYKKWLYHKYIIRHLRSRPTR